MDLQGNLVVPAQKEVYKLAKLSNSYQFLTNPEEFLTNLSNDHKILNDD